MKRVLLLTAVLLAAAGYVLLQTSEPAPNLAAMMPGGALLYLETPNFGRLLRDWDSSSVKTAWLASANYEVFSHSNLFSKLSDVYSEYGGVAGLLPNLKTVTELAGSNSALALYDIHAVEFLYVSRIAEADLMQSPLWGLRAQFERRQAGGTAFYLRTDPATKRTVAFAFAKGLLLVATRDDLIAQALELLAGGSKPSVASDRWYREATLAAANPGEVRLVMNLQSLVGSPYFRSYWIQRNASAIRQYWAGVADVRRTANEIVENRVFLRSPEAVEPPPQPIDGAVSSLLALVPEDAGVYKAFRAADASEVANLIIEKLIGRQPQPARDWREAPEDVSPDRTAGSEADLETRIDEQTLPIDSGMADAVASVRGMVANGGVRAVLAVQSSMPSEATFVRMPAVVVLDGSREWDGNAVRETITNAVGGLWTTSRLGVGWKAGSQPRERLDGLGSVAIEIRGHRLFLSNDLDLLNGVLKRSAAVAPAPVFAYAAGARYLRERANYSRVMNALDYSSSGRSQPFDRNGQSGRAPKFFAGNLVSLSDVLSHVTEVSVTEEQRSLATVQTVIYKLRP